MKLINALMVVAVGIILFAAPGAFACSKKHPEIGQLRTLSAASVVSADREGDPVKIAVGEALCAKDSIKTASFSATFEIYDCDDPFVVAANSSRTAPTSGEARRCALSNPKKVVGFLERLVRLGHLGGDVPSFALPGIENKEARISNGKLPVQIPLAGISGPATLQVFEPGDKLYKTVNISEGERSVSVNFSRKLGDWKVLLTTPEHRLVGQITVVRDFEELHADTPFSAMKLSQSERALALACWNRSRFSLESYRNLIAMGDLKSAEILLSWEQADEKLGCGSPE